MSETSDLYQTLITSFSNHNLYNESYLCIYNSSHCIDSKIKSGIPFESTITFPSIPSLTAKGAQTEKHTPHHLDSPLPCT